MAVGAPAPRPGHVDAGEEPARLTARGLTFTPDGAAAPVLAGIDLDIAPGERVLLVGASGSGKSTLLRALAGVLEEIDPGDLRGEVLTDGRPVVAGDGRVGLVVQDPADARVAGRVGRDVAFGPENLAVPRAALRERVAWALELVGFPYGPQRRTDALSGGEAQRLALAGVLAMRPGAVLLDEPTAMLDAAAAGVVREGVRRVVAAHACTLVVVEHRLAGWVDLVDRLVVLGDGGTIVADGPVEMVLRERREELLACGIWVPGAPEPQPLAVPSELVAPLVAHPPWAWLVRAQDVSLRYPARRGLSVVRRGAPPAPALDRVDVSCVAGAVHALTGPSGAGKSSLLGLLAGLEAPTSGWVRAAPGLARGAGDAPYGWTSPQLAERIGWVPQRAELTVLGRTVAESILVTSRALGRDEAAAQTRARGLLDLLGLLPAAGRDPHRLSGGELRRLAVASGLAHGPDLLALDEPTVGQDRHTWAAVVGVVRAAADAGAAVPLATHDAALLRSADVQTRLVAGRIGAAS